MLTNLLFLSKSAGVDSYSAEGGSSKTRSRLHRSAISIYFLYAKGAR